MLSELERQALSARTRRYALTVLRASLQRGLEVGVVTRNVAKLVHPPKQDRNERRPFTVDQIAALFDSTAADSIGPLVVLSATTGLRQGEALALRWEDVDLETGVMSVRHTLDVRTQELAPTKTDRRGGRSIFPPLPCRLFASSADGSSRTGYGQGTDGTTTASCLHPGSVPRSTRATSSGGTTLSASKRAPQSTWHHLRHFAATALLEAGEDLFVVSRVLGHTSVATTASFYGHVRPAMLRRSAERMDELLSRAGGNLKGVETGVSPPNNKALRIARRAHFVRGLVARPGGIRTPDLLIRSQSL